MGPAVPTLHRDGAFGPATACRPRRPLADTATALRGPIIYRLLEVAVPRLDAIHAHLKQHPWPARLPAGQSLLNLALALMEVSLAVESHGQPTVPFGFDPARLRVHL